jgi:glutathione S-transferase
MMTLYANPVSGNVHKVRIALALLGLPHAERHIDFRLGEHRRPPVSELNPLMQLPILVDGDLVLRDSQAILTYLAARYAPGVWDGETPAERGRIAQWLAFAAVEIAGGAARLRLAKLFGLLIDVDGATALSNRALDILETRLATAAWLEGGRLTIADIVVAPYVALAPQGGVDLAPYLAVRGWLDRLAALPGFPDVPGWMQQKVAA